jgi:hypothetical protein
VDGQQGNGWRRPMTSLALRDAREVLSGSPFGGSWRISRASSGWSRRTFVATDGVQRLFLKFDVEVEALRRLADLEVMPPVLDAGEYRGHSFVVQPYLRGRHPQRSWFDGHHTELARLVRAYQRDGRLRNLISPSVIPTHRALVDTVIDELEHRYQRLVQLGLRGGSGSGGTRAIDRLRTSSGNLQAAELVPTHGDPNLKNFVLANAVYLVDWDDLALSDPLRDVGQLMWWYLPPSRWDDFFGELGLEGDDHLRDRLFWWAAAESLDVALSLAENGDRDGASDFFDDFAAAIEQRPNPRLPPRRA